MTGAPAPEPSGRDAQASRDAQARQNALASLAALGPFFAVQTHQPGLPPPGPWQPLSTLIASPAVLAGQVAQARAALAGRRPVGTVETRVAASVTHLGLTARLLSPAFGLAAQAGFVPPMDPAEVGWQPAPSGPVRLSLPGSALAGAGLGGHHGEVDGDLAALAMQLAVLLGGLVRLLTDTVAAMSVSRTVLRGNVASAVSGAAAVIGAVTGTAWPAPGARAAALSAALLRSPPLAGAGTVTAAGFRRHSCCLIYRAGPPGRPFCGDCVLNRTG